MEKTPESFLQQFIADKHIRVHLWIENEQKEGFGIGRIELLDLIDQLGSLNKAAKVLGMSYRGAWGKIKKAEQLSGVALVVSCGSKRDGYSLTPEGKMLIQAFRQWALDVSAFADSQAKRCFQQIEIIIYKNHF